MHLGVTMSVNKEECVGSHYVRLIELHDSVRDVIFLFVTSLVNQN